MFAVLAPRVHARLAPRARGRAAPARRSTAPFARPLARPRRSCRASSSSSSSSSEPPSPSSSPHVLPGEPSYPGLYCDWSVTPADTLEVWAYRASLSACALGVAAAASPLAFGASAEAIVQPAYFFGAAGLGASLALIHMYVDPIKKFMQACYALGLLSSVGIAATHPEYASVPAFVLDHPGAVWLVGPMFAALTGVAFKEGMCYGKPECAALFFTVPAVLLGHLTGLGSEGFERGAVGVWVALMLAFAARKYTQEVKDDIGDKSVFIFNAMSDEERDGFMRNMNRDDPARFARLAGRE